MATDTFSQWSIVLLLLVTAIFAAVFYMTRRSSRKVPPRHAARYYAAYLGETFRLAGFDAGDFLRQQDLRDGNRVIEIYCVAEGALLARIMETLDRPDHATPSVSSPTELTPGEYDKLWRKRTAMVEDNDEVGDEIEKSAKDRKKGLKNFAMLLLRKINPVIQQVAGTWVGARMGMPGG